MSETRASGPSNVDIVRMYWHVCWNERRVERLSEVFHGEYTHGGVIFGLSATARAIDAPSLDVFFFRDGRVARWGRVLPSGEFRRMLALSGGRIHGDC